MNRASKYCPVVPPGAQTGEYGGAVQSEKEKAPLERECGMV